jgi:AcrR family transcriptional regulator
MGVYNRLGGKDGLVDALLIKGFDRLRAAVDAAMNDTAEPSMRARFLSCGLSYRQFALDNPHFYAIMFEDAFLHTRDNPEVEEHAKAAFGALVRIVELSAAAGVIAAHDPVEVGQQIWSTLHGAVALELRGLVLTPDPRYTYQSLLTTLIRGLAPR